jgi:hypothetical protein
LLQTASVLTNPGVWTTVSTNTLVGTTLNVTNPAGGGMAFWRAVWQP